MGKTVCVLSFVMTMLSVANTQNVGIGTTNPLDRLSVGSSSQFTINAMGHPFFITNTPGTGSFSVGVTNNGMSNTTITFTVPMVAPATLYYYCSAHAAMNGMLMIQ